VDGLPRRQTARSSRSNRRSGRQDRRHRRKRSSPVLVFDKQGSYVNSIRPDQFHLYDNTKEQNISVDVVYQPISLVIAIQANSHVEQLLPHVQKIGNLITPLLIGDQGEAALIAYDARIRVLQDFTSDPDKITQQVKKIYPGSTSNRWSTPWWKAPAC